MLNVNIERILGIIESGEFKEIETYVAPIGATHYNVTTYNGGIIRLIHANKVWFTKEYVDVLLFVPNKNNYIFWERYKSNHELFNRVYEAWNKISNEYENNEFENDSKFF